jgi:hypothetical protein
MRALTLSAALVLLAAAPAVAGDRSGGHPGGPCCAPPPPPPSCCNHGGSRNVNINVNASARASAEASAFAGSYFNAHAYDVGGMRGRGSGGTVYVGGGGYGGDMAWGYAGAPVYYDIDRRVMACASAPFGYVVTGFGREGRQPPSCGAYVEHEDYGYDRGGRYGYSERHDSYEARSYESYESYEEYGAYEESAAYSDHGRYDHDRRDCDCRERAPYPPPYLPEPPRYEPPAPPPARPHRPRRSHHEAPPRQQYRQEPGERG